MTRTRHTLDAGFEHLGKHLLAARQLRGWTQKQLGRSAKIDPATVNRIEQALRLPTLPQLIRLAAALRVSLQWFLTGTNRPGVELRDLALELENLGAVDLLVHDARVPAAFHPPEQVVSLVLADDAPQPRILEALPAVLAWNHWKPRLLYAYAAAAGKRAVLRLAWLADVALTIDKNFGFPNGCAGRKHLEQFLRKAARAKLLRRQQPPGFSFDDLGRPARDGPVLPLWKRWGMNYAADLTQFRDRALQLVAFRDRRQRS